MKRGFTLNICLTISDINECSSNPCFNSGLCTDGDNGYTCTCQPGTSGVNCETGMYLIEIFNIDSSVRYIIGCSLLNDFMTQVRGRTHHPCSVRFAVKS